MKTFASIRKPISITVKSKEKSITTDRDLFARLVVIAKSREIDIRNLFQYELTTVPLSLLKLDDSLNKSLKSLLLAELEKNAEVLPDLPRDVASSTWIVDGMALIQMVRGGKAKTFGELAQVLLKIILNIFQRSMVKRVDVTFDRYDQEDSIKSAERQQRTTERGYEIKIYGPNMPIPKQWHKYLQNAKNKASLAEFLREEWSILASQLLKDNTK